MNGVASAALFVALKALIGKGLRLVLAIKPSYRIEKTLLLTGA